MLTELLEFGPAHACRRVPGDRTEDRPARGRAREQSPAHGREREQRDDETRRQPDPSAEYPARPRRRLVLLHDLGLAALASLDDRRVVGIDQARFAVEVLHEL